MSYLATLATAKDQVRFLIGDTSNVAETELLKDDEITFLVNTESNVYRAAAFAAEAIAAKYSRLADVNVGDTSVSASQQHEHYRQLAKDLKTRAIERGGVLPFAGGVSRDDVETRQADSDRVEPYFERTAFDTASEYSR